MSTTTPFLGLVLYDSSTDQVVTFATFRAVWGGTATSSNFYKIDTAIAALDARVDTLEGLKPPVRVPASFVSSNFYQALSIADITAYTTGMTILLSVDITSSGTVTLDINSLGTKSVMKVDSTGTAINLTGSDLVKNRQYLFMYDGTRWLWVSANSADQIQIVGTVGNLVSVGSTNNLVEVSRAEISQLSYLISPSVTSNNLTVAIKYYDNTDASATKPITFRIGNTMYTLTAATSFTKNAGTNWCNSGGAETAALDIDYFVYAIGETGASAGIKFGFSRISHAQTMADFVNTTTSEKYIAGNWTNYNASDVVTLIGRFRAMLGVSASYNWSIPTSVVINRPTFETDWLSWTPQYSANGSMTYTSVSTTYAKYKIARERADVMLFGTGTTGGTASNQIQSSMPFSPVDTNSYAVSCAVRDATSGVSVVGTGAANGSSGVILARKTDSSNWTLGAGRIMQIVAIYPI